MKKLKIFLFTCIILNFVFPVGEAGAIFLLIAPGAAAQGTGEANVARVDDAYASYYNPASLAFQTKNNIAGMHVNWLKTLVPDLYYEYLGFSMPIGKIGGIGGHLIFLSLGEQTQTDEVGQYIGKFNSYMYALDGSYGTKLTDNSAIGLGFKIYHQKLADTPVAGEKGDASSTDFAFDISYLYKYKQKTYNSVSDDAFVYDPSNINLMSSDYDKFSFGFNIANIGPPISFIDEDQADPAPTNMRIGFFSNLYNDDFTRFNIMVDMQKLLVAKYPSMDWDGDGLIGDGILSYDASGDPIYGNMTNSDGQNEASYSDPWYTAWATAWLDDWYYGGDIDWDGDKKIGGYYWVDGCVASNGSCSDFNNLFPDGQIDQHEIIQDQTTQSEDCIAAGACNGDPVYSSWDSNTAYVELGSGDDRKFSDELKEVILNTGFEFWYTDSFVLRAGYIYDEEGDIKAPTFGAGLRFAGYGFDFGYTAGDKNHPRSGSLFFSISAEI